MNERTKAYFDDLVRRAAHPPPLEHQSWPSAVANFCHRNCELFDAQSERHRIVRGWLVVNGCWFIPHSVIRETATGKLIDITPMPADNIISTFVEHRGTESDFAILRQGRDGGWLHPPPA